MDNSIPFFQEKKERRLITKFTLDNLIKFHEMEHLEKYNAIKLYSAVIGGGLALLTGMNKTTIGIEGIYLKYLATSAILTVNLLVIKKLLSIRYASNNIYNEYGRRLRYLINAHTSDLTQNEIKEFNKIFVKYVGTQKIGNILPEKSVSRFEIIGISLITILFSSLYLFPIKEIFQYIAKSLSNTFIIAHVFILSTIATLFHVLFISIGIYCILKDVDKRPNIEENLEGDNE